jgi:transketolase
LAGALSCVDILVACYWNILKINPLNPTDFNRDRFIFSKGHAVSALYITLAHKGFFPYQDLDQFNVDGGILPEQPSPHCVPGVEWATGSLGHGLSVGIGMALAAKIHQNNYKTIVLMSDGESQEGSVWEAAMFAPKHNLNSLTVIIDYNKWQATGKTNDIMQFEPFKDKWIAFGWNCVEVDGHNIKELTQALQKNYSNNKPLAIVAHTVKGKGVSFIEDDNNWHYRSPTLAEVALASKELNVELSTLSQESLSL